jgi:hypothetical protein
LDLGPPGRGLNTIADKAWASSMNVQCICCCTGPAAPLQFEAFIREASHFRVKCQAFGALKILLEPKGGRTGRGGGGKQKRGIFWIVYFYLCYLTLLHLRLSDSTMSGDAGIEPGTVATLVLAPRRSN